MTLAYHLRQTVLDISGINHFRRNLNNQYQRDDFVVAQLGKLPADSLILDAGCGSQRYRTHCGHLHYRAQDFAQYTNDLKPGIGSKTIGGESGYQYGPLNYVGDVCDVAEESNTFDAILCTEVLEHIPFPIEAIKEFQRLLKPNGVLILTAPSNCLRHMDPYFFYTGFSDRWYETILAKSGFDVECIEAVGDYYSWMGVEIARSGMSHSSVAKLILFPAFVYFYNKRKTAGSTNALCMGYHVVARKQPV